MLRLRWMFSPFLIACALSLYNVPLAMAQENQLFLNADGKVLLPFQKSGNPRDAKVLVQEVNSDAKSKLRLHCRPMETFDNQAVPLESDKQYIGQMVGADLVFAVPIRGVSAPFLFCSLLEVTNKPLDASAVIAKQKELDDRTKLVVPLFNNLPEKKALDLKRAALVTAGKDKAEQLKQFDSVTENLGLDSKVEQFQKDIAVFQQKETEGAVSEIKRLQELIRSLGTEIATRQADRRSLETRIDVNVTAAQESVDKAEAVLAETQAAIDKAKLDKELAEFELNRTPTYVMRHSSHLFLNDSDRAMVYRVTQGTSTNGSIALERIGKTPTLTTETSVFAVVVNRRSKDIPQPFQLTFSSSEVTPPNPTPVRPTTPVAAQKGTWEGVSIPNTAYTDFVMSLGHPFRANTVIKATVATVLTMTTEDSTTEEDSTTKRTRKTETKLAELIKDQEFPQVRALYRFNFTSGVAYSFLRKPSFTRVKTKLDDPATADKDESEYATERTEGDVSIQPIFAITVYPRGIDIQRSPTWTERFIPAPMVGFAFTNPHENMYLGFNHEVLRNFQFMWGVHLGKSPTLRTTKAPDDPKSSAGPQTDDRFQKKMFYGVSFNVDFIKSIFTGR